MIGDYLTTTGRSVDYDMQMFDNLKLRVRGDTPQRRSVEASVEKTSTLKISATANA